MYVEGEIETRVYNDSINGAVKNIPEICVRRDGMPFMFFQYHKKQEYTHSQTGQQIVACKRGHCFILFAINNDAISRPFMMSHSILVSAINNLPDVLKNSIKKPVKKAC